MLRVPALLCVILLVCGCGGDSPGATVAPPPPPGANDIAISLSLSSGDPMTSAGDTRSVVAVVLDAAQTPVSPSPTVSWSTSAPTVATVNATGPIATIRAIEDGTATITATSGSAKNTVTVTVRRRLAFVVLSAPSVITVGFSGQLTLIGLDGRHNAIPGLTDVTYSSNNPTTVPVSPTGLVNALFQYPQTLTATITATATKDGVTVADSTGITVVPPSRFDYAALMLSDYEKPTRVSTPGAGIAYFVRDEVAPATTRFVFFLATWSALSGPATSLRLHGPASFADVVDVLVDIPLAAQTTNHGTVTGLITAADIQPQGGRPAISLDSLIALMGSRNLYVEVRSAAHPRGEIRGQTIGF